MALPLPAALLGLSLAIGLPTFGSYRRRTRAAPPDWAALRSGVLRYWGLFLLIVTLGLLAGGPADLGLSLPSIGTLIDGVLIGYIAFGGTMLLVGLVLRYADTYTTSEAARVAFDQPLSRRLWIASTNAVVEPIVYLGFVLEAVVGLGGPRWLAGVIGATGLLLVRAQWSPRNALQWLPGSVILAGIAVVTRSVVPIVLIRFLYDGIVLVVANAEEPGGESSE